MDKGNDTETLAAQISEKLPPSDKIPPQLMRVIWKATEKDQIKRFQTVKEFKQAITMALTYQLQRWKRQWNGQSGTRLLPR